MAFVTTIDLVSSNGTTYSDTAEFVSAHGPCGTENSSFITEGTMSLLDGGTGVRVVLSYVDQAAHDSHRAAFPNDYDGIANISWNIVSAE
tara:strand:- start:930 stop:1199 length:270 start_codon:yes stop_codon:yes gene_type:complete